MKSTKQDQRIKIITDWIKQYLKDSHKKGIVFGVSGGIDSALIAAIASKYFAKNHMALTMNIENSKQDIDDAKLVIKHFNLNHRDIKLEKTFNELTKACNSPDSCKGNVKSRLRMISLYSVAQELDYLVIGTANYDELMIGYFTKYGDSGSDILPLVNLVKQDVIKLAQEMGVPEQIIHKKPTAGLYEGQTDEAEIGISYHDLDEYFLNKKASEENKEKIERLIKISEHKRSLPASVLPKGKIMKGN